MKRKVNDKKKKERKEIRKEEKINSREECGEI